MEGVESYTYDIQGNLIEEVDGETASAEPADSGGNESISSEESL